MDIKEVKYYKLGDMISGIKMTLADDSVRYVPRSQGNTDYDEIKRQVDAGTLTIKDAD
jgi:hypothetical protein